MKKRMRAIAAFLAICIVLCSLTSCSVNSIGDAVRSAVRSALNKAVGKVVTRAPVQSEQPTPTQTETETEDAIPTEKTSPSMKYCLTEADFSDYLDLLDACEAAFLNANSTEEELGELEERFTDAYYHIVTQSQIAYINYCMNTRDEAASANYLFSSEASADAYDAYMQMCKRVDESNSPWKSRFFEGWTADELEEMRGFSGEVTRLTKANDQILVAYRELDGETFYDGAANYYVQLVENNNDIAQLMGYENYWTYANAEVYGRDYGKTDVQKMRQYVGTYLVPLCEKARNTFQARYAGLSGMQRKLVEKLFSSDDYESFSEDYVEDYLSTFDEERKTALKSLWEPENSFFGQDDDAHQGAFTVYLYSLERPVCYFGPGYQDVDTVIHELGHYYSYLLNGDAPIHMDLAEVQSQGNEWLFWAYMSNVLSEKVAETVYAYCLYDSLATVIACTAIDEFEQICYEREVSTAAQADAAMAEVKSRYGGDEWLASNLTDLDLYWRCVTVEQPVYYVSYAVSMLAAMQIYTVAENQSYEAAMELYLSLMSPISPSLMKCLNAAGLKTPMDEALYLEMKALI